MTGEGMKRSVGVGLLMALACPLVLAAQAVQADSLATAANAAAAANTVAINFVWTLVAGFLVMFMQAGFAMVKTGFTRAKNAAHTITMNFMVYGIAMLAYWVVGFALQAGGVGALGTLGGYDKLAHEVSLTIGGKDWGLFGGTGFFLTGVAYTAPVFTYFLFQMVFMDTAATIPTGALAERWKFSAFVVFSVFVGAFIYPIYANWTWGGGWLALLGKNLGLGHGHEAGRGGRRGHVDALHVAQVRQARSLDDGERHVGGARRHHGPVRVRDRTVGCVDRRSGRRARVRGGVLHRCPAAHRRPRRRDLRPRGQRAVGDSLARALGGRHVRRRVERGPGRCTRVAVRRCEPVRGAARGRPDELRRGRRHGVCRVQGDGPRRGWPSRVSRGGRARPRPPRGGRAGVPRHAGSLFGGHSQRVGRRVVWGWATRAGAGSDLTVGAQHAALLLQ